jgi:hypothetical protein
MLRDTQHPLYAEINETWIKHIQPDLDNKITFS